MLKVGSRLLSVILIGACAAVVGCSRRDSAAAVATVSLTPNKPRVALDAPIDLAYRFDVAPGASIAGDYRVFVHVNGADGKLLWSDDHDPPTPTSQWKPGQIIQYTRTRFVPVVAYVGDATIEMGLYRGNDRLSLSGSDPADRKSTARQYKVATLQLLPRSDSIFVTYTTGWHPLEYAPDDPMTSWQWMQKSAGLDVRNPHSDVTLLLQYDARPDLFPGQPQHVTVYSNDQPVTTFVADSPTAVVARVPITAAQLGSGDSAKLRLDVDRTFTPAKLAGGAPSQDMRELGIRVYHAYVEGR